MDHSGRPRAVPAARWSFKEMNPRNADTNTNIKAKEAETWVGETLGGKIRTNSDTDAGTASDGLADPKYWKMNCHA